VLAAFQCFAICVETKPSLEFAFSGPGLARSAFCSVRSRGNQVKFLVAVSSPPDRSSSFTVWARSFQLLLEYLCTFHTHSAPGSAFDMKLQGSFAARHNLSLFSGGQIPVLRLSSQFRRLIS